MTFTILTDSTADLSLDWLTAHEVEVAGLTINMDGQTFETVGPAALTSQVLLEKMETGSQPTTSQVNVGQFETMFEQAAQEKRAILYLAFSSALSGTYQSAVIAREMVLERYPDAIIDMIDTKAASIGEGYLVQEAVAAKAAGQSLEEVKGLIADLSPRLRTYFLVDDLNHLVRGGRLSKAAALIGGLVNIKPLLAVNAEGKLEAVAKIRGKKKGLKEMIQLTLTDIAQPKVALAYTGDRAVAEAVREELLTDPRVQEVEISPLGPVIATHTGVGVIAVVSVGHEKRA